MSEFFTLIAKHPTSDIFLTWGSALLDVSELGRLFYFSGSLSQEGSQSCGARTMKFREIIGQSLALHNFVLNYRHILSLDNEAPQIRKSRPNFGLF